LFWKKGKDKKQIDEFEISFDTDRRTFFRVTPTPEKPVYFQVGASRFKVEEISAGGFRFQAAGFRPGQNLPGLIRLPDDPAPIPVVLTIVKLLEGGLVAVQIEKIKEESRERLHYYVLNRQKDEMERKRQEQLLKTT